MKRTLTELGDLISMADLSKSEIERILELAKDWKIAPPSNLLQGTILANCFFEPSTRTRLSFETAMLRLGGATIGFSEATNTSTKKGETLSDSIRVISAYADILVVRHPAEGSARAAADATEKPVINAGDGSHQHPTQTLVDLFTIRELQGKIDELHIALAGDLKFGRTVHSLAIGLSHYAVRLYFVSQEEFALPEDTAHELRKRGVKFSFHPDLSEVLPKLDILYMTRLQKERLSDSTALPVPFVLRKNHLESVKSNFRILHPLPRVQEIDREIDATPYAAYFEQAANGIAVRQAILATYLGRL